MRVIENSETVDRIGAKQLIGLERNPQARRAAEFQRYKQTPLYRFRHPGTAAAMNTRDLTSKQEAALYTGLRKLDRLG